MGRLFGTDGVRGVANHDLTCELAMKLGRAAAAVLINKSNRHPRVIIGKDTRLSSDMLENAMAAGLCRALCLPRPWRTLWKNTRQTPV